MLIITAFGATAMAAPQRVPASISLECKFDMNSKNWGGSKYKIKDFSTDGCSCFPDGLMWGNKSEWLVCCEAHDIAYWAGHGNEETRSFADEELFQCVKEKTYDYFAKLVWSGPRGASWFNTGKIVPSAFRWGYGWPFVVGVGTVLSDQQRMSIAQKLPTIIPSIEKRRIKNNYPPLTTEDKQRLQNKISELFDSLGYPDRD